MSQMLKSSGGNPQSAGYHNLPHNHATVSANANMQSMSLGGQRSSPLNLSSSQHYGQPSSAQHHQQQQERNHMIQQHFQQQHRQQQQQHMQQTVQQFQPQSGKVQPSKIKVLSHHNNPPAHSPQYQHRPLSAGSGTGVPILGGGGGGGGTTYHGLLRRNHAVSSTANAAADNAASHSAGSACVSEAGVVEGQENEESAAAPTTPTDPKDEKEIPPPKMANTKEKTPMCLINELARFNKVNHLYTLVDEQGPAHKKTFFVKLKLGEEEYSAQGESIKKAQHSAASMALKDTKFAHPVPKVQTNSDGEVTNITPTVELNALAMKRGEPAVYKMIEPRNQNYSAPSIDYRGMFNQRYHYGRPQRPYYVMLRVGTKEFIGDGTTRQTARHNAATKALRVLRHEALPQEGDKVNSNDGEENEEETDDAMKSEISLVHELALKRNLPVIFEVVRESGPPHMKHFVTRCLVGDLSTESEGNSKKLSKKRAAELMLEELKKLPPLTLPPKPKLKHSVNKKKNRNIIKVQKADPSYGVGVNPISRLIQIMQAQKKKEPVYTLVAEKGLPRRREFVMQCQVEETKSEGVGPNKKLAKRSAAESMLQTLGFSRPSPQPVKPAIKTTTTATEGGTSSDKKVTFVDSGKGAGDGGDPNSNNSAACQAVPGLLRLNHIGAAEFTGLMQAASSHNFTGANDAVSAVLSKAGPEPEKQAIALADHLNIPIKFEAFTKNNHGVEYLTRVTLSTNPVQEYHGTGPTRESSLDAAALSTVKNLLLAAKALTPAGDSGGPLKTEVGVTALPHQLNGAGDHM